MVSKNAVKSTCFPGLPASLAYTEVAEGTSAPACSGFSQAFRSTSITQLSAGRQQGAPGWQPLHPQPSLTAPFNNSPSTQVVKRATGELENPQPITSRSPTVTPMSTATSRPLLQYPATPPANPTPPTDTSCCRKNSGQAYAL